MRYSSMCAVLCVMFFLSQFDDCCHTLLQTGWPQIVLLRNMRQVGQDSMALLNVVERRTVEERLVAFQEANPQVGLLVL